MEKITLPTERKQVKNYNPRLMVLYGKPKSGKSSAMASLDDNLIIDLEEGYRSLPVMSVDVKNITELFAVKKALEEKITDLGGKFPYRFITIDNATRLEELALFYAASLYRKTQMGAKWGLKRDKDGNLILKDGKVVPDPNADVRTLAQGSGYLYLRQAVKEMVHMFQPLCETLILVCHVKDKQINVDGSEQTQFSVDLAGKLGDIICGEADAIGYVYRQKNQTIISFEGGGDTIREARPTHLRGKRFVIGESDENNNLKMDLSKIFLKNGQGDTTEPSGKKS